MKVCVVFLLVVYGAAWVLSFLMDISCSSALARVFLVVLTAWVNFMWPVVVSAVNDPIIVLLL